jgi:tetratricopeptide (TPR) repeat protein
MEMEDLRDTHPRHAVLEAEVARLQKQEGRTDDALRTAGEAIRLAFIGSDTALALQVWETHAAEREKLVVDGETLDRLAGAFMQKEALNEALWCYRKMLTLPRADAPRAQKGLIAVAEAAAAGGHPADALRIFDFILTKYPQTPLRDQIIAAKGRLNLG